MEYADINNYTAGNKARNDILRILREDGAVYIPLFHVKQSHIKIGLEIVCSLGKTFLSVKKGDIVYIQYPYQPQMVNSFVIKCLRLICRIKNAQYVVFVHDINSMRTSEDKLKLRKKMSKEAKLFSKPDYLVAHNEEMIKYLRSYCDKINMLNLQLFDYLYDGEGAKRRFNKDKKEIVIAGNLSQGKSNYIYNLSPNNHIIYNLYGINYENELQKSKENVHYFGAYDPNELIKNLQGTFGLVWDGDSTKTCNGPTGEYLKYNNPHKASLYIASGLPIIVWEKSALAKYVKENQIGCVIQNLDEISEICDSISIDDYEKMCVNVDKLSNKITKGYYTKQIIKQSGV